MNLEIENPEGQQRKKDLKEDVEKSSIVKTRVSDSDNEPPVNPHMDLDESNQDKAEPKSLGTDLEKSNNPGLDTDVSQAVEEESFEEVKKNHKEDPFPIPEEEPQQIGLLQSGNNPVTPVKQVENEKVDRHARSLDIVEPDKVEHSKVKENLAGQEKIEPKVESLSKLELLKLLEGFLKESEVNVFEHVMRPMKIRYDSLVTIEKDLALLKFIDQGNEKDDFEYRGDETDKFFYDKYDHLRTKKNSHYLKIEKQRIENLKKKEEILIEIRKSLDGDASADSLNAVKALQDEWRKIGPVHGQNSRALKANYNALLDRFYDARKIYFELRELDRKKNLKLKITLCEKAEALSNNTEIKDAVSQLNDIHEEYKKIGHVPREMREEVWQRLKTASDKIYEKRRKFILDLKQVLQENLEKKILLIEEVNTFKDFDANKIKEWNKKTKDIQALQRKWENIGSVPRQKAKELNKEFWKSFKSFFVQKNKFYKQFESEREDNLILKKELVAEVVSIKDSSEWNVTAQRIKQLQAKWKDIGPVPEKFSTSTYEEFKSACDEFFDRKRAQNQEQNQQYEKNLEEKSIICKSIKSLSLSEKIDINLLYDFVDQFNNIGFVPMSALKKIQHDFDQAISSILVSGLLSDEECIELKTNIAVSRIKSGPNSDQKIYRKENTIKKKIDSLMKEINTWKTNMDFFASSKAADTMKREFEIKLEKAEKELKTLKNELRLLSN